MKRTHLIYVKFWDNYFLPRPLVGYYSVRGDLVAHTTIRSRILKARVIESGTSGLSALHTPRSVEDTERGSGAAVSARICSRVAHTTIRSRILKVLRLVRYTAPQIIVAHTTIRSRILKVGPGDVQQYRAPVAHTTIRSRILKERGVDPRGGDQRVAHTTIRSRILKDLTALISWRFLCRCTHHDPFEDTES